MQMKIDTQIRSPAVAGKLYPDNSDELSSSLQRYLQQNKTLLLNKKPLALIVPHANYHYCAPIAASAYKQIVPFAQEISRVVLLGPAHHEPLLGIATSNADAFQTPLGNVPLDKYAIQQLSQFPFVQVNEAVHHQEHSLEVQLPFLQKILPKFRIIPLVIGQLEDRYISDIINSLWQEDNTLFLASSDLSHYLDYTRAVHCDQATANAIENLQAKDIHYEQACGRSAIAGLLLSAQKHGLQAQTLDLRNSGDTQGDKEHVIGYGAWAFY